MIYLSVQCSHCNGIKDGWYRNTKDIKNIKNRTKDWVEVPDGIGTLCPECYEKYKNGELKF